MLSGLQAAASGRPSTGAGWTAASRTPFNMDVHDPAQPRTDLLDQGVHPHERIQPTLERRLRSAATWTSSTTGGDGRRCRWAREILGITVASAEDGAGWVAFMRELVAPRPDRFPAAGHLRRPPRGLVVAVESPRPGPAGSGAGPAPLHNLLPRVLKSAQLWVATLVRTIFDQPAAEGVYTPARPRGRLAGDRAPGRGRAPGCHPRRPVGRHDDGHHPRSRRVRVS